MTSREKIIVLLLVVVVVWGLFTLSKGRSGKAKPVANGQAAASVVDLASNDVQSLQASLPGSNVVAYLEEAGSPCTTNPFADVDSPAAASTGSTAVAAVFVYSGHIKAGSQEMAIINGREYFEGETLSNGGYVVEKVSHDRVLLRGKENGETSEVFLVEQRLGEAGE